MITRLKKSQVSVRVAFLNLLVFVFVSLLVFIQRSGVSIPRLGKASQAEEEYSKRLLYFFWPSKRLDDKLKERQIQWERTVNKTQKQKREKRLPDVVIAGAERCGAESLTRLLQLHPLVKVTSPLDTRFFTTHYAEGLQFYKEMMPWASEDELVIEASPTYFSWPPVALPKRVKSVLPRAKILVVLCNPADRTYVDYNEELKVHRLPRTSKYEIFLGTYLRKFAHDKLEHYMSWDGKIQSIIFDSFTADYATHIITSGMYYYHAVRWKAEFGFRQLKFIDWNEMMTKPGETMEDLQKFLHIPMLILKEDFVENKNPIQLCFETNTTSSLIPKERRCPLRSEANKVVKQPKACADSLKKFYVPYNLKLYRSFNHNYGW